MPARVLSIPGYSERVLATVTLDEQERRWTAVRHMMEAERLDALVFHTTVSNLGGYVRWISDLASGQGYPISIVLPIDQPMTAILHGPNGDDRRMPADNPMMKGIDRVLSTTSFTSAHYTATIDGEAIAKVLTELGSSRVGLVGLPQMSYPMVSYLYETLGAERFVDAQPLIDPIKAVKSAEEIAAIRRTAALQDEAFQVMLDNLAPGVREIDLMAIMNDFFVSAGGDFGVLMVGASDGAHPAHIAARRMQAREFQAGDHVVVLLERNGIEGQFAEVGRTLTLGPAPDEMHREWEFVVSAQDHCVSMLRPGITGAELLHEYNAYLRDHGRPEERRLHLHGQGYDIVERPFALPGEDLAVTANMNFALHPTYAQGGYGYKICDNYLTTDGDAERLHTTERKIFEL